MPKERIETGAVGLNQSFPLTAKRGQWRTLASLLTAWSYQRYQVQLDQATVYPNHIRSLYTFNDWTTLTFLHGAYLKVMERLYRANIGKAEIRVTLPLTTWVVLLRWWRDLGAFEMTSSLLIEMGEEHSDLQGIFDQLDECFGEVTFKPEHHD